MMIPGFLNLGRYRGYEIACFPYVKNTWRVTYRDGVENEWIECHVLSDDELDAAMLVRQVIDYRYLVEVFEALEGREYDPVKDGNLNVAENKTK